MKAQLRFLGALVLAAGVGIQAQANQKPDKGRAVEQIREAFKCTAYTGVAHIDGLTYPCGFSESETGAGARALNFRLFVQNAAGTFSFGIFPDGEDQELGEFRLGDTALSAEGNFVDPVTGGQVSKSLNILFDAETGELGSATFYDSRKEDTIWPATVTCEFQRNKCED